MLNGRLYSADGNKADCEQRHDVEQVVRFHAGEIDGGSRGSSSGPQGCKRLPVGVSWPLYAADRFREPVRANPYRAAGGARAAVTRDREVARYRAIDSRSYAATRIDGAELELELELRAAGRVKFDWLVGSAAMLLGLLAGLVLATLFLAKVADRHGERIQALEDWRSS